MNFSKLIADINASKPGPETAAIFDFDGTIIAGFSATVFLQDALTRGELKPDELYELTRALTGFGLGNMGSGMASNLQTFCARQGHVLLVSDLDPAKVATLIGLGAKDGGSVANIASQVDLLFTSLPSSKEVNLLAFGEAGILANAKTDCTWIETSTNELAE